MKKQVMTNLSNTVRKAILQFSLASFFLFLFVPALQAQERIKSLNTAVAIKYIGMVDDNPLFQIEFDNKNTETYHVSIKDEEGNILYNEKFRDLKYSRKFKFERHDGQEMKLTFVLSGEKESQTQVFEVSTSIRVIQDVVVTRL